MFNFLSGTFSFTNVLLINCYKIRVCHLQVLFIQFSIFFLHFELITRYTVDVSINIQSLKCIESKFVHICLLTNFAKLNFTLIAITIY